MKRLIIAWLKRNGFQKMEANSYANDVCDVVLLGKSVAIADNNGNAQYGEMDIDWVIGNLTRRGFIDKNYKN